MTLANYSVTTSSATGPGPGQYGDDRINTIGGKYSVHCHIRPRYPSKVLERTGDLTESERAPLRSSLSSHGARIGKRFYSEESEPSTGPQYLPDPREGFKKGVVIKGSRDSHFANSIPGPGTYDPREPSKTQVPTQGGRLPIVLDVIPESPGPAAYNLNRDIGRDSLKFTIRPRTALSDGNESTPGYKWNNPAPLGEHAPKYTISRAKRLREDDQRASTPGPGAYDPQKRSSSHLGPTIRPRVQNRDHLTTSAPYLDTTSYPRLQKKTIGIKSGSGYIGPINDNPGPNYLPNTSLNLKGLKIHEKIEEKPPVQMPGPSDYNPFNETLQEPPRFTMKGPSSRMDWLKPDDTPGPGNYEVRSTNTLPKWTIGERTLRLSRQGVRRSTG